MVAWLKKKRRFIFLGIGAIFLVWTIVYIANPFVRSVYTCGNLKIDFQDHLCYITHEEHPGAIDIYHYYEVPKDELPPEQEGKKLIRLTRISGQTWTFTAEITGFAKLSLDGDNYISSKGIAPLVVLICFTVIFFGTSIFFFSSVKWEKERTLYKSLEELKSFQKSGE